MNALPPLLLIAEDDEAFRTLLTAELQREGYRVEAVSDGAELMSRLTREPRPSLLLSDVRMPWLEGIEALALADRADAWVPTILLTSFADEALRNRAKALEARVLSKPVDIERLLVAITESLSAHSVLLDGPVPGYEEVRPIAKGRPALTSAAAPCNGMATWARALRSSGIVLLAEDDDELRELLSHELARDGHGVVAARDGESLLSALAGLQEAGRSPHVVVTDFRMPERSGLEVARWVAQHCPRSRVVMISAFATEELQRQAHEAGVAHVLAKPFDADDLRTVVMHVMR